MAQKPKGKPEKRALEAGLPFGRRNYLLFGIGLVVIVVGFIALGMGSITLAPILLVLGYLVIIPLAIILKPQKPGQPPAPVPGPPIQSS